MEEPDDDETSGETPHLLRAFVKTPFQLREGSASAGGRAEGSGSGSAEEEEREGQGAGSAAAAAAGDHPHRERSATMSRLEEYEGKALYLATTTSSLVPPGTAPSTSRPAAGLGLGGGGDGGGGGGGGVFDPENDFDFDSKTATPDTYATDAMLLQHRYTKLCHSRGMVPVSLLLKQIGNPSVVLRNVNLNTKELKAALTVLVMDTELTRLDISGNNLIPNDSEHINQLLRTNRFLTHLVLSENHLSGAALDYLIPTLIGAKGLRSLDLSGNGLCDRDSASLCHLIEDTECINELILHHNQLGQCGVALGAILANNDTITNLNLSWNHIRGPGAVGLAQGVGKNGRLTAVNFAWNGFGYEGCVALGQALRANSTLQVLNLTNNRIHPPALLQLLNGVCANKTLSFLSLAFNPIPAHVSTYMLSRIDKWKHGNLKQLDLQGLVVDGEFPRMLEDIQAQRMFFVRFDLKHPLQDRRASLVDPNNIYNIDPMRILYFMKEHLRTIDLFLKIDKDGDGLLTKKEMKMAFELEGYPVSDKALDQVMGYLDTNKSGEVDLGEFFQGEKKIRRSKAKKKLEEEERLTRLKREGSQNNLDLENLSPAYSQAFKKPPPRLPKLTK